MLYKCRSSSFPHILILSKQITAQVCLPFLLNYWPWLYIVNCTGYKCLLEHNSWQSLKRQSLHIIFSVSKQLMLILAFLSFQVLSFDKMVFFSILTVHLNNFLIKKKKKAAELAPQMKLHPAKSYWPSFLWKTLTSLTSIGNQSNSILCQPPHPPSACSHCRGWHTLLPFPMQGE